MARKTDDEWVNQSSRRRALYKKYLTGPDVRCWICRQPGADSLDHVKPRSKFPDLIWDESNLVPAHLDCNGQKGAGTGPPSLGVPSEEW